MTVKTQDGIIIVVTGGEKPHVGAVAIGVPRKSLRDPRVISSDVSVFARTGHRDDVIARDTAGKAAAKLNEFVVVIAGVHVDTATQKEIEMLVSNAKRAVDNILKKL